MAVPTSNSPGNSSPFFVSASCLASLFARETYEFWKFNFGFVFFTNSPFYGFSRREKMMISNLIEWKNYVTICESKIFDIVRNDPFLSLFCD